MNKKDVIVFASLEDKISMLKTELMQCIRDFEMWRTANGTDYPERRIVEIREKIREICGV